MRHVIIHLLVCASISNAFQSITKPSLSKATSYEKITPTISSHNNHHVSLSSSSSKNRLHLMKNNDSNNESIGNILSDISRQLVGFTLSLSIVASSVFMVPPQSAVAEQTGMMSTVASATSSLVTSAADKSYDGFAEYAKENQMEQSDVGCFIDKCGDQTKNLFKNPRGIKGIVCLGQCKGEQSCATRCFAEYGSESLNDWLSCTIEENECVKVPKSIDNSAENVGYNTIVQNFDPTSLIGKWYKTDGLNPNYDLFDCQTNTFEVSSSSTNGNAELDMGIFFRVRRPAESGGGFWENSLTEHMVVDAALASNKGTPVAAANAAEIDGNDMNPIGRTMHTSGKMYGLQFSENWYILGESDGKGSVPAFKLVAYKGHTLQGNYEGAFVYAKEPVLPAAARDAVADAAAKAGLSFNDFQRIDNTCPPGDSLNDAAAGTGTSTTDWINLVVGEGGVIDWISPGWRGEYKK